MEYSQTFGWSGGCGCGDGGREGSRTCWLLMGKDPGGMGWLVSRWVWARSETPLKTCAPRASQAVGSESSLGHGWTISSTKFGSTWLGFKTGMGRDSWGRRKRP